MEKRGVLALDIDGTLSGSDHHIPDGVAHFLKDLSHDWEIFLITGRSFTFAETTITKLEFPFYLAVQNGADIMRMHDKSLLLRNYIDGETLKNLDELLHDEPEDFLLYSGYDLGDYCYYRPKRFSEGLLDHFEELKRFSPTDWHEIESLQIKEQQAFPLVKYFGKEADAFRVQDKIATIKNLTVSVIRDPLNPDYHMAMITHVDANKGTSLKKLLTHAGMHGPIIAAGDDNNDEPMLNLADCKIVMGTAPPHLLRTADIVAAASTEMGIIDALQKATSNKY
ncbi:MAG: HAD family hydrolase [Candidatus Algichlamydia australiensis]|nr:HAD family hydrolase [Chlamydiales bacterium]